MLINVIYMLCDLVHDDFLGTKLTMNCVSIYVDMRGNPNHGKCSYGCSYINYVIITCYLMPWTLESMRSLRRNEMSWETLS